MSTFAQLTKHPKTGQFEKAIWHDDYFGHHLYGVEFESDGEVYDPSKIEFETKEWPETATDEEKMPRFKNHVSDEPQAQVDEGVQSQPVPVEKAWQPSDFEMLVELIARAKKGGCDWLQPNVCKITMIKEEKGQVYIQFTQIKSTTVYQMKINDLIYDRAFAQAVYGSEPVELPKDGDGWNVAELGPWACGGNGEEVKTRHCLFFIGPWWQYHMMFQIIAKKPLQYMFDNKKKP